MIRSAVATFLLSSGFGSNSSTCAFAGTIESTFTRLPPTFAAQSAKIVVVARTSFGLATGVAVGDADGDAACDGWGEDWDVDGVAVPAHPVRTAATSVSTPRSFDIERLPLTESTIENESQNRYENHTR